MDEYGHSTGFGDCDKCHLTRNLWDAPSDDGSEPGTWQYCFPCLQAEENRKKKREKRNRAARLRYSAYRDLGMKRTRYGWE